MLTKFVSWVKSKRIDEGVYGQWEYRVPSDPKELMYDFYMLEYLLSIFPSGTINGVLSNPDKFNPFRPAKVHPETGISYDEPEKLVAAGISPEPPMTHEMKFHYALFDTAHKLLPVLKKHLLDGVIFSIAAEIRHVDRDALKHMHSEDSQTKIKNLVSRISRDLGKKEGDLFRKYVVAYGNYTGGMKELMPREPLGRLIKKQPGGDPAYSEYKSYRTSYRAMKEAGGTDEDWARIAKYLFENAEWKGSYGGQNWANIANGWLHLNDAKSPTHIITYIDHVYDLQHNTGSVFTKLHKYAKDGNSHAWIETALDHKRDAVSAHEFLEHLSPSMRDLALIGIKYKTGKTWGDFENEWPAIVEEKTKIYNRNQVKKWEKAKEAYEKEHPGAQYYESKPKPISVEQFERNELPVSDDRFNLGRLTKHHQEEIDVRFSHLLAGATKDIPELSDFKAGDEVARQWPPRTWFKVRSCDFIKDMGAFFQRGESCDDVVIKYPDGSQYLSTDYGPLRREDIKGFRPKDFVAKQAKKEEPAAAKPKVYQDYYGNPVKLGDTVKTFTSIKNRIGTVVGFTADDRATVRWNTGEEKGYLPSLLVVQTAVAKEPEKPKEEAKDKNGKVIKVGDSVKYGIFGHVGKVAGIDEFDVVAFTSQGGNIKHKKADELEVVEEPEEAKEVKDANDKVIKVGDDVEYGYSGLSGKVTKINLQTGTVTIDIDGIPKHVAGSSLVVVEPPKPVPKKGVPIAKELGIKELWDQLAGTPVNLRFARVLKGMKKLGGQNYHELINKISQETGVAVNKDEVMKIYWEEDKNDKYYKAHGASLYPGAITPETAASLLTHSFVNAPYVYIDHKTLEAVEKALLAHNNELATNTIAKATKFSPAGAKGLAIYTKLGMYAAGSFHA